MDKQVRRELEINSAPALRESERRMSVRIDDEVMRMERTRTSTYDTHTSA
jgi:hypothetical protein